MDDTMAELVKWHMLNLGCISRNRFWGEDESKVYRKGVCSTTLLLADGKRIVVDPSHPGDRMEEILFARSGLQCSQIDMVYITHFHADHFEGIDAFLNARWLMPANEFDILKQDQLENFAELLKRIEPVRGSLVKGVELIHLPGHTPGLSGLVFEAAEGRVIIAGDAVMTRDFFKARQGYFNSADFKKATESIDVIAETADIVVPGHDNYFVVRCTK